MALHTENPSASLPTIELRFLSGPALGQCHYATAQGVSLGDDPTCDVRIVTASEYSGERCKVQIVTSPAGWHLTNLGTSMVALNQAIVAGEAKLKSGDVIRLSLAGPDVMFSIVAERDRARAAGRSTAPPALQIVRRDRSQALLYIAAGLAALALLSSALVAALFLYWLMSRSEPLATATATADRAVSIETIPPQSVDEGRRWELDLARYLPPATAEGYAFRALGVLPKGMQLDTQTGRLNWTPSELQGPDDYPLQIEVRVPGSDAAATADLAVQVREVNSPPRLRAIPDATFALGTSPAFELQVVAEDDDQPKQPIQFRLGEVAPPGMEVDQDTGLVRWTPQLQHAGQAHPVEVLAYDAGTSEAPQKVAFRVTVLAPTTVIGNHTQAPRASDITASLYLLVVEESTSGTLFPFATGFAVRNDLLVTSGTVVQELAKMRDQGKVVLAIHCATQNQEEITALYLDPEFSRLADKPDEQIYHDLGAVQLTGGTRAAATLAANTFPLEQGAPLRCVMPVFEAEPLTKFDNIVPTDHPAKVYLVTRGGDTQAAPETRPRLIALVGDLPKNAYGSPLLNEQGEVVALYVEKADLSNNESLASLAGRYHYALCLDALTGRLDEDRAAWQLKPAAAAAGASPAKQ